MSPKPLALERRRERGAALLITSLILVVIGAIAFTGMRHSEQESTAGSRSRANTRTFYAADAGIQIAANHLAQEPADLSPIDVTLANNVTVQSRTRSDAGALSLTHVGVEGADEGESLGASGGVGTVSRVYLVTVTATAPNGATSEVEAKIARTSAEATGY